ncbi:uncharacterized protein LOC124320331 [Daphnia pulicaria]|uniref:uncharacterized protein LOC124320331 n=1 Tax=Daphnia pulicaria TaxID=35523 RepID=UPI001EEA3C44|nr:uncharacterized protein LOC124320331 [Daphnia pulicaria]
MPYRKMENNNNHACNVEIEPEKVGMAADAPAKQYLVRRSKKLPAWLWISIAQALGIRIRPNDRAIVATVLYASTIVSALVLVISTSTYVIAEFVQHSRVDELKNNQTGILMTGDKVAGSRQKYHTDVMDGIAMVSLTIFWCLLGLYAKNLAYRLYNSSKFLEMVRLHAKTILKVNAAFVFFLLMTTFVAVHNISAYYYWYADRETCSTAGISPILCQIRFIALCVFSIFAILWNSLVGIVLLSVCRTNTMGIRRFIQDLERDAIIYERQRFGSNASYNDLLWVTENDADQSSDGDAEPKMRRRCTTLTNNNVEPTSTDGQLEKGSPKEPMSPGIGLSQRSTLELHDVTSPVIFQNNPPSAAAQSDNETKDQIKPMSTAVVLQRYWRLSCSTRISSVMFQRWTTCVTTLCLSWVAIGLVQWLSYTPHPLQVAEVCIPMMILPLLCAAYAEVNGEGKRLLKCICPMEQRLHALYVMWQSPPQMTIFGMNITYGAMGTAAAGLLLALTSRVVLKQLGAGSS